MRRSQMIPLLLAAIFAAPLALAWGFYHAAVRAPQHGLQRGELLLPLKPLPANPMLDDESLRGRWTLLYTTHRCTADCHRMLATLQQVRLAQGAAMTQVERVLVLTAPPSAGEAQQLGDSSGELRVFTLSHWPLPDAWLYLIDPRGNMVLRYRPGFEPHDLLKDLQRLLRQSGAP